MGYNIEINFKDIVKIDELSEKILIYANETVYEIKDSAKILFEIIKTNFDLDNIISRFNEYYILNEKVARKDVIDFLYNLWINNLIIFNGRNYFADEISINGYEFITSDYSLEENKCRVMFFDRTELINNYENRYIDVINSLIKDSRFLVVRKDKIIFILAVLDKGIAKIVCIVSENYETNLDFDLELFDEFLENYSLVMRNDLFTGKDDVIYLLTDNNSLNYLNGFKSNNIDIMEGAGKIYYREGGESDVK